MTERLSPERAVRLLRAKAGELEAEVKLLVGDASGPMIGLLAADIALVAGLLADHIERSGRLESGIDIDDANVREREEFYEGPMGQ